MDTIRALIYFAIGFLLAILAGLASASITPTTGPGTKFYAGTACIGTPVAQEGGTSPIPWYGSWLCPKYSAVSNDTYSSWRTAGSCTTTSNKCKVNGSFIPVAFNDATVTTCPSNSTLVGSVCECNAGYVQDGNTCVIPTCPTGQTMDTNNNNACRDSCLSMIPMRTSVGISGTGANAGTFCFNGGDGKGCTYAKQGPNGCVGTGTSIKCYYSELKATGATCNLTTTQAPSTTGDETAAAKPIPQQPLSPEGQCVAKGMSYGEVNGQIVCIAKVDSSQPTTAENTTQNADGTSTTTSTTTNTDGSVSKTTTQRDAQGNVTSTVTNNYTTTTDFCAQNPDLTICGESSASTTESCDTPPACTGDAVQCAILTEQWRTRCANVLEETDANVQEGQTAIDANGSTLDQLGVTSETVNIAGQIEQTAFLGAGCVSDQTVSLGQYGSFTIPFSSLCSTFNILGNILVALAFIGAARITTII